LADLAGKVGTTCACISPAPAEQQRAEHVTTRGDSVTNILDHTEPMQQHSHPCSIGPIDPSDDVAIANIKTSSMLYI